MSSGAQGVGAQGFRLRARGPSLLANRGVEQLARERDEFFVPERLVAKLRPKLPCLGRLTIVPLVSHRGHYAIFSHFGRRIPLRNVQVCTRVGGCVSPILVRPVREQLEHDRIIRLLQAKYKRKFDVAINPGNEQTAGVGGPPPWYPDLVLQSERGKKVLGVVEVETTESVNHLEAMSEWRTFSQLRTTFHLYVPASMIDVARRLCE